MNKKMISSSKYTLLAAMAALGLVAAPCVQAQTLVDRYSFNDTGTTVVDSVGVQNGILLNRATESGGSLITDRVNSGANAQFPGSYKLPTDSFSIETFFTPTAGNSAFATTFSFGQDTGNFSLSRSTLCPVFLTREGRVS